MDGCCESHTSNSSSVRGIELHSTTHSVLHQRYETAASYFVLRKTAKTRNMFKYLLFFKWTWIHAVKVCSLCPPLPYFDPQNPITFLACGCKCEVWRFVKAGDSVSVCLRDWEGDHCQLTGPSLLSLFKGFVKAAALSHPH